MRLQRAVLFTTAIFVIFLLLVLLYIKLVLPAPQQLRTVAVILKEQNYSSAFWQTVKAGAEAAAKESGAGITITGPLQDTDVEVQIRLLTEALQQKPQAVVVAPIQDSRVSGLLQKFRDAKIPLVLMNTPDSLDILPAPPRVTNDHIAAGIQAGSAAILQTHMNPKAVILSDYKDSGVSSERENGIRQALEAYKDSIYGTYYSQNTAEASYTRVRSLIQSYPAMNTVIALSESSALGAVKAINEAKKSGIIKLISFDTSINVIKLLEENVLSATVVQQPFNMGYLGVEQALDLINGEKVNPLTQTTSIVITRDNMYSPENQKLLFPFIDK